MLILDNHLLLDSFLQQHLVTPKSKSHMHTGADWSRGHDSGQITLGVPFMEPHRETQTEMNTGQDCQAQ